MADVQVQNNGGRGGMGIAIVVLVIVVLALVAWIVFGGGLTKKTDVDVEIQAPSTAGGSKKP